MRIGIGVVIGVILIIYWWMQDHPHSVTPAPQGSAYNYVVGEA